MNAANALSARKTGNYRVVGLAGIALTLGLLARLLLAGSGGLALAPWLPWLNRAPVTLYYADSAGGYLVPVSQRLPDDTTPRAVVESLFAAAGDSGLNSPLPDGTAINALTVEAGTAYLDLATGSLEHGAELAALALTQTLLGYPGVEQVQISVAGAPLSTALANIAPLYYVRGDLIVAVPGAAREPRAALDAYLNGAPDDALLGLPPDVRLTGFALNPANGLLSLEFSYTAALREFAIHRPDAMRNVLTGLIASMTAFPEVRAVHLDFDGHAQLGLGQCANLLRAPQTQPTVLNDIRLIGG